MAELPLFIHPDVVSPWNFRGTDVNWDVVAEREDDWGQLKGQVHHKSDLASSDSESQQPFINWDYLAQRALPTVLSYTTAIGLAVGSHVRTEPHYLRTDVVFVGQCTSDGKRTDAHLVLDAYPWRENPMEQLEIYTQVTHPPCTEPLRDHPAFPPSLGEYVKNKAPQLVERIIHNFSPQGLANDFENLLK